MKNVLLASTFALGLATTHASAQTTVDDPLHGMICGPTGCTNTGDNGTNTPITPNPITGTVQNFGFTSSPAATGTLTLDVLIPDTTNLLSFTLPSVTGSGLPGTGTSVTLFNNGGGVAGVTDWSTGTLAAFLLNGTTGPDMNINAYLPSTRSLEASLGQTQANGFFVFQLTGLGPFNLPTPNSDMGIVGPPISIPDIFSLSRSIPGGSYIVGSFVGTQNSNGHAIDEGTANSAALFVQPLSSVPGPTVGQGLPALAFGLVGMIWLVRSRQNRTHGLAL